MRQEQFLDVVDEVTAHTRFDALCAGLLPRVATRALADGLLGLVLATDVRAPIDVPGFDRSNVDGFAVRARDTFGAEEMSPRRLRVHARRLAAGDDPVGIEVEAGVAVPIATGAVLPRGADAVVMVEDTQLDEGEAEVEVTRASAPGSRVAWAGTDLGRGEVVLRRGQRLSSRDTGLLAAIGVARVEVFAPPVVAIVSTGDELRAPGEPLALGQIYDSNARIVSDAVVEAGGEPRFLGILPDDEGRLERALEAALSEAPRADLLVLSGGTSKGAGDLNARVVEALAGRLEGSAGIVVHGVALKPGKPLCLAGIAGRPVAILPGFPTSAIFTFHEFLAPFIRRLAGRSTAAGAGEVVSATMPLRLPSVAGRTQYVLVNLVRGARGLAAYPLGSGSGSVSTFSRADGFVRVPQHVEYVADGSAVEVRLLGIGILPAELVCIGSHCIGLDYLLGALARDGVSTKSIVVGSSGGLRALARGEGDVAGTHLLDPESGAYNEAFLPPGTRLLPGYRRRQGLVFRLDDPRFQGARLEAISGILSADGVRMVNRNKGSGTRVLVDRLLSERRPQGYETQARSHHAVAAAVVQGRADWGLTLEHLAREAGLGFVFVQDECYDFAVREESWERPAVRALRALLASREARLELAKLGLEAGPYQS